ncbi:hypothetical protein MPL3356_40461 [Mesorhizobium plurifarium]|uniref:Uncharacterized protein n=1 Tax=Mesorhizobium plurifarium TaxID=69974 RepID=A0A090E8M4_MESPL|nr:hypothetical protein MPL3356_40461 [Mesorhizobium plurifarium]
MLHAAQNGKTVHDLTPLFSMRRVSHTPPDSSLSGGWQGAEEVGAAAFVRFRRTHFYQECLARRVP